MVVISSRIDEEVPVDALQYVHLELAALHTRDFDPIAEAAEISFLVAHIYFRVRSKPLRLQILLNRLLSA